MHSRSLNSFVKKVINSLQLTFLPWSYQFLIGALTFFLASGRIYRTSRPRRSFSSSLHSRHAVTFKGSWLYTSSMFYTFTCTQKLQDPDSVWVLRSCSTVAQNENEMWLQDFRVKLHIQTDLWDKRHFCLQNVRLWWENAQFTLLYFKLCVKR